MAMRVKKAPRRGVGGDCQRHHSHLRWNQTTAAVISNKTLPYAAMRSILPQSGESYIQSATASNLAYKLKPIEDTRIQADVQHKAPPVRLATSDGNVIKGDDEYQHWLKEYAWTPKSIRNSVVSLIHPDAEVILTRIVEHKRVMIHGIPLGNLTSKFVSHVGVPVSWGKVKEEHLKRSAHSRAERHNNVTHILSRTDADKAADFCNTLILQKKHAEPTITKPILEDIAPPWVTDTASNDAYAVSTEQAVHHITPAVPSLGLMEQVQLLRQTRQDVLRAKHLRSSGFMEDVQNKRLGESQYYERMKYVRGSGVNTEAGYSDNSKAHSAAMYMQRRAWYKHIKNGAAQITTEFVPARALPDARNSDSHCKTATHGEQVSIHQQLHDAFHPPHNNRELWNGPPPPPVVQGYHFPSTEEIISRAQQRVAREDKAERERAQDFIDAEINGLELVRYHSWMRGHANRTVSVFDKLMRLHVLRHTAPSHERTIYSESRRQEAWYKQQRAKLDWWLHAYAHRRHSTFDSYMTYGIIGKLTGSEPVKKDVFSQVNDLMQSAWRKLNRANPDSLQHTVAQMTKGILLPKTAVINRPPAMAKPRGKS